MVHGRHRDCGRKGDLVQVLCGWVKLGHRNRICTTVIGLHTEVNCRECRTVVAVREVHES